MKFKTTVLQFGNNTGIEITEKQLEELNGGKKPLIVVTLNNYSYKSAVGKMKEKFLISLSSENRKKAGVKGGDIVEVSIELDKEPRTVEIPNDLKAELDKSKDVKNSFEKLAPSKKKAIINSILEAKTQETRERRVQKAIQNLKDSD